MKKKFHKLYQSKVKLNFKHDCFNFITLTNQYWYF